MMLAKKQHNQQFGEQLKLWVIVVFFFGLAIMSNRSYRDPAIVKNNFLKPPSQVEHLTFGYRDVVADVLWLRVIQDYSVCGKSTRGEIDVNEVRKTGGDVPVCSDGWVYHMVDAVTKLSPKFRMAYATGATVLSILVNDPSGAEKIFDKAIKAFPNDWSLQYRAGYHQLFELKNELKAAEMFALAGKNGAPAWVNLLAGRLATENGKAMIALSVLEDYRKSDPNAEDNPRYKALLSQASKLLANNPKPESERAPSNSSQTPQNPAPKSSK